MRKSSRGCESRYLTVKSLEKNKNQASSKLTLLKSLAPLKSLKTSLPRHLNLCSVTGKARSFYKAAGLSRHALKKKAEFGHAQNFRSKSW
jgi:ribosomal protein S14